MDGLFAHNDSFAQSILSIEQRNDDLYVVILDDDIEVVFHLLPYKQALQYAALIDKCPDNYFIALIYDTIFERVAEGDWRVSSTPDLPAGVPQTVARLVLYLSGVEGQVSEYTESLIATFRDEKYLTQLLQFMMRTICSVFPAYTFKSLYDLTYQQLVELFVQAERLLLERGIIKEKYNFNVSSKNKRKRPAIDINQLIEDDQKMLQNLNAPPASTQIYDDPRYKLKQELHERRMRNLHKRLGRG